jgi:hypothetical protein
MITSGWRALAPLRSLLDLMHPSVSTPSARKMNCGSPDSLNRTWKASVTLKFFENLQKYFTTKTNHR